MFVVVEAEEVAEEAEEAEEEAEGERAVSRCPSAWSYPTARD